MTDSFDEFMQRPTPDPAECRKKAEYMLRHRPREPEHMQEGIGWALLAIAGELAESREQA